MCVARGQCSVYRGNFIVDNWFLNEYNNSVHYLKFGFRSSTAAEDGNEHFAGGPANGG